MNAVERAAETLARCDSIAWDKDAGQWRCLGCDALILAPGGMFTNFRRHQAEALAAAGLLVTDDDAPTVQAFPQDDEED